MPMFSQLHSFPLPALVEQLLHGEHEVLALIRGLCHFQLSAGTLNTNCLRVLLSDLFLSAVVTGCYPATDPQDAPSILNFGPHTVIIYSILLRGE